MKYSILSIIIFVGLSTFLNSGTIDPKVQDKKYIEYGNRHECVVRIAGKFKENNNIELPFTASAVIIKPKAVLTAAHVVQPSTESHIILNDKKIKILGFIIPNKYTDKELTQFDIALCILEEEAKINFYPELYDKDDEIGKVCSISGFGMSGTHISGININDNRKRAGSNIIENIFKGMLLTSVNTNKKTALEFLIANGDSGGGLFIDQKLAGINSAIMTSDKKLDSNINDEGLHTRVSIHKKWIESVIDNLNK